MRHLTVSVALFCSVAMADEKIFPTVDANGHITVIRVPVASGDSKKVDTADGNPVKAPSVEIKKEKSTASTKAAMPPVQGAVGRLSDDNPYQSSEELEKNGYKPEGKNRFYYLPDGSVGKTPLESEAGMPILMDSSSASDSSKPSVRPSPNYRTLSPGDLNNLGIAIESCLSPKRMKNAKSVLTRNAFRVNPPIDDEKVQPDLIWDLRQVKPNSALFMVSYAETIREPGYYVPIVVFHDGKGCVVSGAWNYWINQNPATDSRYESIESVLLIGDRVAFATLYYPEHSINAKLPFANHRQGSLTVEIYE